MNLSDILTQAAAQATLGQQHPNGTLLVLATPIGNLADLSLRAIHLLSQADAIACEDTRHTVQLLRHLGLEKPLIALHQHNEKEATPAVLQRLAQGQKVVLVSDAGTPAISDPGALLVAAVQQAGHRVMPLPGPSSSVAAMSVAGDVHAQGFVFVGFLPPKLAERQTLWTQLQAVSSTRALVLFEAPHRIQVLAQWLAEQCPDRQLTVCRELTKQFESVHTLLASDWPAWLQEDANRQRGEFVIVVHALPSAQIHAHGQALEVEHESVLKVLLSELPLKQAVSLAAQITQAPRNVLYARALALKSS